MMALDAEQNAALKRLRAAVKDEGVKAIAEWTGLHRSTLMTVLADTARESTIVYTLDRFMKAEKKG
jgi:hypothetical protein